MKIDNKKRKTNCLNCEHSYRGEDEILSCHKGHTTSVTNYDCIDYEVFIKNKEELYEIYKVMKQIENKSKPFEERTYKLRTKGAIFLQRIEEAFPEYDFNFFWDKKKSTDKAKKDEKVN